jgi:phage gp46-like protein
MNANTARRFLDEAVKYAKQALARATEQDAMTNVLVQHVSLHHPCSAVH